jgi:hypothetical protein
MKLCLTLSINVYNILLFDIPAQLIAIVHLGMNVLDEGRCWCSIFSKKADHHKVALCRKKMH